MRATVIASRDFLAKNNIDRNSGRPNTGMDYDSDGYLEHLKSDKEEIKASMKEILDDYLNKAD